MRIRGRLTTIPDNLPVPAGTDGELRRLSGNTLLATLTTDASGWFEYEDAGHPGPFKITWNYDSVVREQYSEITGPSGVTDISDVPVALAAFGSGVVPDIDNELEVTANGSGMQVAVATGAALVRGMLFNHFDGPTNLGISAAHATLSRIDTVVVRAYWYGHSEEGRIELDVLEGTPSSTPSAPALNATTDVYDFPLANVTIDPAVIVIGSDKVTDRREEITSIPPDGSITTAKLADNSVTSAKIVDGTIVAADIADATITAAKLVEDYLLQSTYDADEVTRALQQLNVTNRLTAIEDSGVAVLAPASQYVATGALSSGTRTLGTLGIGPLESGVQYMVVALHYLTMRGDLSTGTAELRVNINGGTNAAQEYQHVGNVPRGTMMIQTATITGSGASVNIQGSVRFLTGDPCDVRAGFLFGLAMPLIPLRET